MIFLIMIKINFILSKLNFFFFLSPYKTTTLKFLPCPLDQLHKFFFLTPHISQTLHNCAPCAKKKDGTNVFLYI